MKSARNYRIVQCNVSPKRNQLDLDHSHSKLKSNVSNFPFFHISSYEIGLASAGEIQHTGSQCGNRRYSGVLPGPGHCRHCPLPPAAGPPHGTRPADRRFCHQAAAAGASTVHVQHLTQARPMLPALSPTDAQDIGCHAAMSCCAALM